MSKCNEIGICCCQARSIYEFKSKCDIFSFMKLYNFTKLEHILHNDLSNFPFILTMKDWIWFVLRAFWRSKDTGSSIQWRICWFAAKPPKSPYQVKPTLKEYNTPRATSDDIWSCPHMSCKNVFKCITLRCLLLVLRYLTFTFRSGILKKTISHQSANASYTHYTS
jgi:hypothetical protein